MSDYDKERTAEYEALAPNTEVKHYISSIPPVDYIAANNLDFFEGNVVKYVTRWRKKGGVEDLRKAKHYIEMLIQQET